MSVLTAAIHSDRQDTDFALH